MGWTFTYRPRGYSNKEWFAREFDHDKGKVLDVASGTVNRNNIYIAYEVPDGVIAVICLTKWVPNAEYNYGWKDMDEGMGAYISDCPQRIIDQLSPIDDVYEPGSSANEWAKEWRNRVAEFRRKWDNKPALELDKTYTCNEDLNFGNYGTLKAGTEFVCVNPKRMIFKNGFRFQLRKETTMELQEA